MRIGGVRFDFDVITSTSDAAAAAVKDGAENGSIFVASYQSSGRGRRGAQWNAAPGDSLLMTVVLYPTVPLSSAWKLGWIACLATVRAMQGFGIPAACKWPNDVVVSGKKMAGILVETVPLHSGFASLIGIGVNIRQRAFDSAATFRVAPTSMALELTGEPPSLNEVIERICREMDGLYNQDLEGWDAVASGYRSVVLLGQEQNGIDADSGARQSGVLVDIRESDGAALLRFADRNFGYIFPDNA